MLFATRWLGDWTSGLRPDVWTCALVSLFFLIVTAAACAGPARSRGHGQSDRGATLRLKRSNPTIDLCRASVTHDSIHCCDCPRGRPAVRPRASPPRTMITRDKSPRSAGRPSPRRHSSPRCWVSQPGGAVRTYAANIGTGGGAMAMVLGRLVGPGRVYATDVTQRSLTTAREYARKEGLTNITVIEGGAASAQIFPTTAVTRFSCETSITTSPSRPRSTRVSTRRPSRAHGLPSSMRRRVRGSELPSGVPAIRGGHGVPASGGDGRIDRRRVRGPVRTTPRVAAGRTSYPTVFLVLFEKK